MLLMPRRSHSPAIRSFAAFTLVELLVVIAIIGVLIGLLLPAVQATREAARATDCKNRMRQLALATLLHHDGMGYFPAARYESRPDDPDTAKCGRETPTWLVRLMPYLEEAPLGDQWDLSKQWHQHPEHVRCAVPDAYLCPTRRAGTKPVGVITQRSLQVGEAGRLPCGCPMPPVMELIDTNLEGALCDYAGNHGDLSPGAVGAPTDYYYGGNGSGVIISVRPVCESGLAVRQRDRVRMKSVTDGTSSTFLFGEKYVPSDQVAQFPYDSPAYDGDHLPASARLAGPGLRLASGPDDVLATLFSFGSWHPSGVPFAFVDGSVRLFQTDTDTKVLGSLANRGDDRFFELQQPSSRAL
ncbi:MAG: DUF1559 domain-containing protein [Planctomycetota bacterium]